MKVIAGLGNPGRRYSSTRHNVGWWFLDHLADAWGLGRFHERSNAASVAGTIDGTRILLLKPLGYMNRSGATLAPYRRMEGFDISCDLLVVVDDVALEPGRARLRAEGSAGGHNGLKSVEATLGTRQYPRLRIGIGRCPDVVDLADWVLSRPSRDDRGLILDLFPDLTEGVRIWIAEGSESAMNRINSAPTERGDDA